MDIRIPSVEDIFGTSFMFSPNWSRGAAPGIMAVSPFTSTALRLEPIDLMNVRSPCAVPYARSPPNPTSPHVLEIPPVCSSSASDELLASRTVDPAESDLLADEGLCDAVDLESSSEHSEQCSDLIETESRSESLPESAASCGPSPLPCGVRFDPPPVPELPVAPGDRVKGSWTLEEDRALAALVARFGASKWPKISPFLPGRSGKQCRERWFNHLDATVDHSRFSRKEDLLISEAHQRLGNQWAQISQTLADAGFKGRTANAVKNHWNSTLRRVVERLEKRGLPLSACTEDDFVYKCRKRRRPRELHTSSERLAKIRRMVSIAQADVAAPRTDTIAVDSDASAEPVCVSEVPKSDSESAPYVGGLSGCGGGSLLGSEFDAPGLCVVGCESTPDLFALDPLDSARLFFD